MKKYFRRISFVFLLSVLLYACGSGGGSDGGSGQDPSLPRRALSFDRPTQYTDNTSISSSALVSEYRIYIKTGNIVFSDLDTYYRLFPTESNPDPVDPAYKIDLNNTAIVSFFNLQRGTIYYLKMRAVVEGVLSDFSDNTISFNFDNNVSLVY